ncbi:hypothetical protein GPALN_005089 [Globodera pallida]|nr:hypothetical protein GPALN_005089 [Globodera pallida]
MASLTLRMALLLVFAALLVVQCSSDSSESSSNTSDESSNGEGLAPAGPTPDNSAFPPFSASNAGLARKKRSPQARLSPQSRQARRSAQRTLPPFRTGIWVHYLVSYWNMTDSELTSPSTRHWFSELDLNHNNKLEPNEIDAALTL